LLDIAPTGRYSDRVVPVAPKFRWILPAVAALSGSAIGQARAGDEIDQDCRSVDDPLAELFVDDEQCTPGPRVKEPKLYPAAQAAARRGGLNPILTTLFNVHTREALPVFKRQPPPAAVFNEFFRCRGFGVKTEIDRRLIDTILAAAEEFESPRVRIISAFRSPKFNDSLAKKGRRVATESRHTRGEAIDFGLETAKATDVGKWLWDNFDGGVGTYANDDFVHIDVGPKRRWSGR
jgi:uncharacterized protein YcbK (DUF882 family)